MVIIRDLAGNIIGKEASASYTPTRKLRAAHEQKLCDSAMGIVREPRQPKRSHSRLPNDAGLRCGCEDAPCCGCH